MGIYSSIQDSLYNASLTALSEYPTAPVIFGNSNGTEPAESYVVISILSITQAGQTSTSTTVNVNNDVLVAAAYEVYVQFSFIGSLSGDMCHSFNQRVGGNPLFTEELQRGHLGYMRKSPVRRAPQKRDTKWVEYNNLDITFSYIIGTQQLVDIVETIVLEDNIGNTYSIPPGYSLNP